MKSFLYLSLVLRDPRDLRELFEPQLNITLPNQTLTQDSQVHKVSPNYCSFKGLQIMRDLHHLWELT